MRRTARKVPTIPIEIAKSRSTVNETPFDPDESTCVPDGGPCVPEELDEDEDAVLDVVPMLLLACDVEETVKVDEVSEGSRTSKMNISMTENGAPDGTVI